MKLLLRDRQLDFSRREYPVIMGIVNRCVDSFSGDGLTDLEATLAHARGQVAEGAEIIDIGAESAGTRRKVMSEAQEIDTLIPFVEQFAVESPGWERPAGTEPPLLSINTWRPAVAREVLAAGGHLLNDIGALPDDRNARLCAETGAALLIMHSVGEPKVPHTHVRYEAILETMERFFEEKIALAQRAGVATEAILLDPGIDFAKQREDNLRIYHDLGRLHRFGRPVLLPVSRKTVIGDVTGAAAAERDPGTVACIVAGVRRGAQLFRVHNVRAARQTILTLAALEKAA